MGQVWGHTPEQRVAAFTSRPYTFGLRQVIIQADAKSAMTVYFRFTDATMKHLNAPSQWSTHLDLGRTVPEGWNPPHEVTPHFHGGAVGTHNYAGDLYQPSLPQYSCMQTFNDACACAQLGIHRIPDRNMGNSRVIVMA